MEPAAIFVFCKKKKIIFLRPRCRENSNECRNSRVTFTSRISPELQSPFRVEKPQIPADQRLDTSTILDFSLLIFIKFIVSGPTGGTC